MSDISSTVKFKSNDLIGNFFNDHVLRSVDKKPMPVETNQYNQISPDENNFIPCTTGQGLLDSNFNLSVTNPFYYDFCDVNTFYVKNELLGKKKNDLPALDAPNEIKEIPIKKEEDKKEVVKDKRYNIFDSDSESDNGSEKGSDSEKDSDSGSEDEEINKYKDSESEDSEEDYYKYYKRNSSSREKSVRYEDERKDEKRIKDERENERRKIKDEREEEKRRVKDEREEEKRRVKDERVEEKRRVKDERVEEKRRVKDERKDVRKDE
jgi:hypothetical protein